MNNFRCLKFGVRSKRILLVFLSILFFSGYAGAEVKIPPHLDNKELIDFFIEEGRIGPAAMDGVEPYLIRCCKNAYEVIEILKDNGFKIFIDSDSDRIAEITKTYPNMPRSANGEPYTITIYAERGPSVKRFWDIAAVYHIDIFIKGNKIERITARVVRTLL